VFIIPMLPLTIAIGFGMHAAWKTADPRQLMRKLRWPAIVAVVSGTALPVLAWGTGPVLTFIGVITGIWLLGSAVREPLLSLLGRGPRLTSSMLGMQIAHAGVGLFVIGVTVTSTYSIETDQGVRIGDAVEVAGYTVRFNELNEVQGANYTALRGEVDISRDGKQIASLSPEKRIYRVQTMPMTEAGIDAGLARDLFVALGEDLGNQTWSLRIQYKPMIRFIWFGCLVMAFGGLVSMTDKRYRRASEVSATSAATADGYARQS
jgi:cytochrome c-type biogenesis protein CcmF